MNLSSCKTAEARLWLVPSQGSATAPAIAGAAMEAQLGQQACWLVKRCAEYMPVSCGCHGMIEGAFGNCYCNPPSSLQKWSICVVVKSNEEAWELAGSAIEDTMESFDEEQRESMNDWDMMGEVEFEIRRTSTGFRWGLIPTGVALYEIMSYGISTISTVSIDVVELRGPPMRSTAHQIAFLMGMHPRLGQKSLLLSFASAPDEVIQIIFSQDAKTEEIYVIQSVVRKERTLESLHIEWYGSCHWTDEMEDEDVGDGDHCNGRLLKVGEGEIVVRQDECYCLSLQDGVAEARLIVDRLVAEHEKSTEQGQILRWLGTEKDLAPSEEFVYRPLKSAIKQAGHVLESIVVTVTPSRLAIVLGEGEGSEEGGGDEEDESEDEDEGEESGGVRQDEGS